MSIDHRQQLDYVTIAKYFEYGPDEGKLYRHFRKHSREVVLTRWVPDQGLWSGATVKFRYHVIMVTHVIFMLQTGRWPAVGVFVDHINGDVFDNCWINLRECTPSESSRNTTPSRHFGTEDGLGRGVYRKGDRYQVVLRHNGENVYHGTFASKAKANAFALAKRLELHGEYAFEVSRGIKLPWHKPVIRDITPVIINRRGL